jgi:hypothetical protein
MRSLRGSDDVRMGDYSDLEEGEYEEIAPWYGMSIRASDISQAEGRNRPDAESSVRGQDNLRYENAKEVGYG